MPDFRPPRRSAWNCAPPVEDGRERLKVARIVCRSPRCWAVTLPGSPCAEICENPASAEALLRRRADGPLTVELCVGTLYIATRLDPRGPRLFGRQR
jgi:hypothetical protein